MKKIALLMVMILTVSLLAGCGGSGGSGVVGKYELVSITEDGTTMKGEELEAYAKLLGVDGSLMSMELTSDGKVIMTSAMMEDLSGEGTYKVDGNKITVTVDDAPAEGTIDGNRITLNAEDTEMIFEK